MSGKIQIDAPLSSNLTEAARHNNKPAPEGAILALPNTGVHVVVAVKLPTEDLMDELMFILACTRNKDQLRRS